MPEYYYLENGIVKSVLVWINPAAGAVPPIRRRGVPMIDDNGVKYLAPVLAYPDEPGVRFNGHKIYQTAEEAESAV